MQCFLPNNLLGIKQCEHNVHKRFIYIFKTVDKVVIVTGKYLLVSG